MADEKQKNSTSQKKQENELRPALIVSKDTIALYSTMMIHLLVGLADESKPSALVCPAGIDVESLILPDVMIIRHPVYNIPVLCYQNRKILLERLERFRPTVLHCLCSQQAALTKWLSRHLDIPYVLTVNSLLKRWRRFSVSSRHCAKITVPAKSIADNINKFHPGISARIQQVNMGSFVEDAVACFDKTSEIASIVTIGPLDNIIEFESLFDAVRHLAIDGYEFVLFLMGDGKAETQLRQLIISLGLSKNVIIVPNLLPRRLIISACDIFVQHRPTEEFNPLVLEAMSVGAVVATCKGGVDDLAIDNKTALVFDPEDELSIYSALQRLMDARDFARKLAADAQEYIRENHSVSKMVNEILSIYHNAKLWYGS